MKKAYLIFGFLYLFMGSFIITGCLNPDNEIPASCFDGELNQDEVQIDCGGVCDECDPCTNGVLDENEIWVDCGGECAPCEPCNNGQLDADLGETGIDCGGSCVPCAELCGDGLLNGNEEDIDCGGECDPCPGCEDGELNGEETGIDCGGPECEDCPDTAGDCTNGEQDGDEFGVDCGGSSCEPCEYYFNYSIDGQAYECPTYTAQLDGNMVLQGITLDDYTLNISFNTPLVGWANAAGVEVTFTTEFAPEGDLMLLVPPGGGADPFSSAGVEPESPQAGVLTITEINVEPPGYIKGNFTSSLLIKMSGGVNPPEITVSNGQFYMPIAE